MTRFVCVAGLCVFAAAFIAGCAKEGGPAAGEGQQTVNEGPTEAGESGGASGGRSGGRDASTPE